MFLRASGCVSSMMSLVFGRVIVSSHWLLLRHEMKLVQPPAVSSIQRDLTAKRVHKSSSMRHIYTLLKWRHKSLYSIQKVPSASSFEYESICRSRLFHCGELSDHRPAHSLAEPSSLSGMR